MSDILQEIEQDLRAERLQALWKNYGKWVIAGAVLIVLATVGFVAWRQWDGERHAAQQAELTAAMQLADQGKLDDASAALANLSSHAVPIYGVLADFSRAALLQAQNKTSDALVLYDQISENSRYPDYYRDLGRLFSAWQRISLEKPDKIEARLQPLLLGEHPLRFSAREILAMSYRLAKDESTARKLLTANRDDALAPNALRERMGQLLAVAVR
ncbi:MAG: hypothetical protein ORN98_04950 [Alphaproteobacteria bacterium]|nr:hypothetical protein [Alphaproteobacteria bacterium]